MEKEILPAVSVVIAAYNSERMLPACLSSLRQNLARFGAPRVEVIGAYRESRDSTRRLLTDFGARITECAIPGVAAAHNAGAMAARGKYILFLNSDDEISDEFIETMFRLAVAHGRGNHVVYSSVDFIDENGELLYTRHPAPYVGWIQKYYSVILHPNALYPRELVLRNPFEILPDNEPSDRQQVYNLMKEAVWTRTRSVRYRFRVWGNSTTVCRGSNKRPWNTQRLMCILGRFLVQAYETNLSKRAFRCLVKRDSHWRRR